MADFFLKIGDIKGESQHDLHKDWIEISSFSFGVSTEGTVFKPEEVVGQDFNFVTSVSRASPPLFRAVITGEHFKQAFLTARRASQDQPVFLKYSLDDVIITSHQQGALSTAGCFPPTSSASTSPSSRSSTSPEAGRLARRPGDRRLG